MNIIKRSNIIHIIRQTDNTKIKIYEYKNRIVHYHILNSDEYNIWFKYYQKQNWFLNIIDNKKQWDIRGQFKYNSGLNVFSIILEIKQDKSFICSKEIAFCKFDINDIDKIKNQIKYEINKENFGINFDITPKIKEKIYKEYFMNILEFKRIFIKCFGI